MIQFEWPWVFLLLPLPWLAYRLLPPVQQRSAAVLQIPAVSGARLPCGSEESANKSSLAAMRMALAAWMLLVVAASRPQWLGEERQLPVSGRDLVLAVDLSGSMETRDFQLEEQMVDRLTAIKKVAGAFIQRRRGDRLGLILFGSNAYLQAPLTFDRKTVHAFLEESVIGLPGKETAIGDAIALAVKKFVERPIGAGATPSTTSTGSGQPQQQRRVLLLLTDGANNAGQISPLKAAQLAAEEGFTIYTIGIGADEMLVRSLFGTRRVNPSADLDEKALTEIAHLTGGRYFRARDSVALAQIHQLLDQLEPVQEDSQSFRPIRALFYWPLGGALLLGCGLAWYDRKRGHRP
ncbi:MAG: VWA domain-containing protein [Magnetococcus sp. MYC-9]